MGMGGAAESIFWAPVSAGRAVSFPLSPESEIPFGETGVSLDTETLSILSGSE